MKNTFLKEMVERGYLHQCTDLNKLTEISNKRSISGYIGFDCTARSLHVGSLLQIMILKLMQKHGHRPIVLLGGGTTLIGDPSGKDTTRKILNESEIKKNIESIKIKHDEGDIKEIKSDYILGFFGLIMQLGPILDWGLNIDKKTVQVNTENFETNVRGIFAIGDICSYPGKLKLILSGFHEGALAARGCFKYAKPDEKLRFEFTTTSKAAQERLGIKK